MFWEINIDVFCKKYYHIDTFKPTGNVKKIIMLPGIQKPEVSNRIIMTPEHAKRLFLALQDNINKYENQHGQITLGGEQKPSFPMGGFGGGAKS